jgi:RNA polymerase-interacting CarD/CdnL/TRCF family regulator
MRMNQAFWVVEISQRKIKVKTASQKAANFGCREISLGSDIKH